MKIIVCDRKHSSSYYDASTMGQEMKSLIKIFKENKKQQFYCYLEDKDYEEEMATYEANIKKLKDLKIADLPTDLQYQAKKQVEEIPHLEKAMFVLKLEKKLYDRAKKFDDYRALKQFLFSRTRNEYERIDYGEVE